MGNHFLNYSIAAGSTCGKEEPRHGVEQGYDSVYERATPEIYDKWAKEGDYDGNVANVSVAVNNLVLIFGKALKTIYARNQQLSESSAATEGRRNVARARCRVRHWKSGGGCQRDSRNIAAGKSQI